MFEFDLPAKGNGFISTLTKLALLVDITHADYVSMGKIWNSAILRFMAEIPCEEALKVLVKNGHKITKYMNGGSIHEIWIEI